MTWGSRYTHHLPPHQAVYDGGLANIWKAWRGKNVGQIFNLLNLTSSSDLWSLWTFSHVKLYRQNDLLYINTYFTGVCFGITESETSAECGYRSQLVRYLCNPEWEPHLCRAPGMGYPAPWCCHFDAPLALTPFHLVAPHLAAQQQHLSESSAPSWIGRLWKQEAHQVFTERTNARVAWYITRMQNWGGGPPLPAVISWHAFRISVGPPAWLQPAFLLILFFWSTTSQQKDRQSSLLQPEPVGCVCHLLPSPEPAPAHLCCRAVQGERWSTPFAGEETVRPCSVSRQSPMGEDTSRLCSTPGPPASGALLWYSGTGPGGTAGPKCRHEYSA